MFEKLFNDNKKLFDKDYICFDSYSKIENTVGNISRSNKEILKSLYKNVFWWWWEIVYLAKNFSNTKSNEYENKDFLKSIVKWLCYNAKDIKDIRDNKNTIIEEIELALVNLKNITIKWWKITYKNNYKLYP